MISVMLAEESFSDAVYTEVERENYCTEGNEGERSPRAGALASSCFVSFRANQKRQTSRYCTLRALSSMNWRRGGTSSPIRRVKSWSALAASLTETLSRRRFSGSIVV